MKAVGLFSGGKDSLYAIHLIEKQGVTVDHLLTLIPNLPWPSPHAENMEALKILAESMGKRLTIVDFKREGAFVEALKSLEVDALVAGDILVEAHVSGLQDVCSKVGLELLEPLYRRDTSEIFHEIFSLGFKALITGVNLKYLREEWLGFIISKETGAAFLSKIGSVDPLGENGEFHTLVLECPLYAKSFKVKSVERKAAKDMAYLNVTIV
ncbi:MAG: diphthine--ammonia ligase [Candidatus Bathyarchaeota archaeon]|nr:diphthine--ammonia ligase [Candidatus Bathyarchaeota archaeon]